ncbi:LPXTG cell wall anchor domain-containing protein [Enterococcus canintestini]|uniref:LPXTG cell wall anchor domain-containing protein n=1 Tax=Enterococcus canintestini TaxID=317010 RepID=UPI00289103D6|nr:LPXTG cell wall anchor domain-containing protein [Enterococcus canintestini]MDT2739283.1 LPXTG cell wall anchor domain-containing protein [Enterococcus canintestini]
MKRVLINSVLAILLLFTAVPVFAAEANYDSNSVTSFYGKYEYKKEDTNKKKEVNLTPGGQTTNYASTIPTYKGQEVIIPLTGDTSYHFASILGLVLLVLIFFKLKEVEDTEKHSNI